MEPQMDEQNIPQTKEHHTSQKEQLSMGQPPTGEPPTGQPPMGQPPMGEPPMGQRFVEQSQKNPKRKLKPYHGIIAIVIFFIALYAEKRGLFSAFGVFASLVGELSFLLIAVLTVLVARGDMRVVFPLHMLRLAETFGSFMLWIGVLLTGVVCSGILLYLNPRMLEYSQQMNEGYTSIGLPLAFLLVGIMPAICEEILFRGVFVNSMRPLKREWLIALITGVVFGIAHGSIYRFFPTAFLGILFAYLVLVTDNMWYGIILHFVNNSFSLGVTYLSQLLNRVTRTSEAVETASTMTRVPLASVSIYLLFALGAPFLLYIGNYLLHRGKPGYRKSLFPDNQGTSLAVVVISTLLILTAAMVIFAVALYYDSTTIEYFVSAM